MKRITTLAFVLGLLVVCPLFGGEIRQAAEEAPLCQPENSLAELDAEWDALASQTPTARPRQLEASSDFCAIGCFLKRIYNDELVDNPIGLWTSDLKEELCVMKCRMD